jgi:hypothetical protein
VLVVSAPEQDRPGLPDRTGPAGPQDVWGADELDELLADARCAGLLRQVLVAAGGPAEAGRQLGEELARNAFRAAFPVSTASGPRALSRMTGRAVAAALAAGLVLSGAAAAAAAGALPGAAQQTAKDVLAVVGVSIPGPNEHAAVRPARPGTSSPKPVTTGEPTTTTRDDAQSGTGNAVSDLARSTAATGVDKGATVSGTASDGKSHAGQHGKPASSSTGKTKTKVPKPPQSKRGNGNSHRPTTPGPAHTSPHKHTSHVSGSAGDRP